MRKKIITLFFFVAVSVITYCEDIFVNGKELVEKAVGVTQNVYPNSHYVQLDSYSLTEYDAEGKTSEKKEIFYKVFDETGKNNFDVLNFEYDTVYEDFFIKKVELIDPTGKIRNIDISKNIKNEDSPSDSASNIYNTNQRIVTFRIPQINTNDIIHIYTEKIEKKPIMQGGFFGIFSGEETFPILHSKDVVIGPKSLPLKHSKVLNPIEGKYSLTLDDSGDKNIYTYEVKDVPKMIPEPAMPDGIRISMNWFAVTVENWEDISKWYYELCEPKMVITDKIRAKAEELTKDAQTDMDKIKSIFFFVSRKVRYMGVTLETNRPGFEPHSTDYTFDTMTGVCRDKAALIVAMLRCVGFDANMVLTNVSFKLPEEVPLLYFNHAICGVTLKSGEDILLDPTDETSKDLLPNYETDKSYVLAKKSGDKMKFTPKIPSKTNLTSFDTTINYDKGIYKCKTTVVFKGLNDNYYRGYLININDKEKEHVLNRIIKSLSQSAKLKKYEILPKDALNSEEPLKFILEYEVDDYVIENDKYRMLLFPRLSKVLGIYPGSFENASLLKRKYPFIIEDTSSFEEKIVFTNNTDKKITYELIPEKLDKSLLDNIYRADITTEGNTITISRYAELNRLEYSPEEYLKLKNVLKDIENYNKRYIILKKNKLN